MASKVILSRPTEDIRREKFEQEVASQHTLAVRTAGSIRKLVLFDLPDSARTELTDFAKGTVDQHVIMALKARDEFLAAEDSNSKLGFFRIMRDLVSEADKKTLEMLRLAMDERHHREKLEAQARRDGLSEPTDEELDAAMNAEPEAEK